jgi:hypothetical protein
MEAETFRLDGDEAQSVERWALANMGGEVIFYQRYIPPSGDSPGQVRRDAKLSDCCAFSPPFSVFCLTTAPPAAHSPSC